jgi:hypothetical protein
MTPLTFDHSEFPGCNIKRKIGRKPAEMVVDSGCTRTLIHKRYLNPKALTGDKITVLTAAGKRLIIPLAWIYFESEQEKHTELVGVMDKLPVDCLLGRSSFGKTLSKQNILDQWEKNVLVNDQERDEAFVMTRRQKDATRHPEAIPLRTTNSKVIADALVQYFCRVGIPEELVSDQGSNFIGKLMTQLYEQLCIYPVPPWVAQTIVTSLSSVCIPLEQMSLWDPCLSNSGPSRLCVSRVVPSLLNCVTIFFVCFIKDCCVLENKCVLFFLFVVF